MSHSRRLALRLGALGMALGTGVGALAEASGGGACAVPEGVGPGGVPLADATCSALVRTLSARMGALVAVATVVVVLTMIGLSRLVVIGDGSAAGPPQAP